MEPPPHVPELSAADGVLLRPWRLSDLDLVRLAERAAFRCEGLLEAC